MDKTTLFSLKLPDIEITMQLYFNDRGQLFFDGYDVGKRVKDISGDSDYEYNYLVVPDEIDKFYPLFTLKIGDRTALLL